MSKKYSLSQSTNKFVTGVSASAFLLSGALNSGSVEAWNLSDLFSSAWWVGVWESILSWFSSTNTQELVEKNVVPEVGDNNGVVTSAQNGENIINLKDKEKKGIEIQVGRKSKENTENLEKNINNERKNGIIGNKGGNNNKINGEKDNDVKENEGEDISEDIKEINIKEEIKENEKKEEDIIKIKNNNENQEKEKVIDTNNKEYEIKNEENSINIDIINTDNKQNDNIEEKKNYEYKTMGNLLAKKDKMPQNSQEEEVPQKSKEDCEKLLKEKEAELGMAKSNWADFEKYKEAIDRFSGFSLYKEAKDSAGRKVAASLMLRMGLKEFEKQKAYFIDNCNDLLEGFLKEYGDESEEDVNRYIKKLREGTLLKIAEDEDVGFKRYLEYTGLYYHVENFWACTFLYIYSECDSAESIEKKLEKELKTLDKDIKDLKKIISDFDKENSGNNKINGNSQILNDD